MTENCIPDTVLSEIVKIFQKHKKVNSAVLFGSRAKGNFSQYSDVDIALYGEVSPLETEAIKSDLDELPFAYSFDVVAYNFITNPMFRRHIDTVGIVLYTKRRKENHFSSRLEVAPDGKH